MLNQLALRCLESNIKSEYCLLHVFVTDTKKKFVEDNHGKRSRKITSLVTNNTLLY